MRSLADQIDDLDRMTPAELRSRWRDTFRRLPPDITAEHIARAIAYRLQERQSGGVAPAVRREIDRLARRAVRTGSFDTSREVSLKSGTRLVRDWHGRTVSVTVGDGGFEFDGRRYGSLTQIAREVTGTSWSGPRFFGLKSKPVPSPKRANTPHG